MKDDFKQYRDRIVSRLPMYAEYVFSFRGKSYMGCGFHYSLEKLLGNVISMSQDVDKLFCADKKERFLNRMMFEIIVRELSSDIVRIKTNHDQIYY